MRKIIVPILLAIASHSAFAEWVKVGDDSSTIVYADPATIRTTGNIARMWQLVDYRLPENIPAKGGQDTKSVKLHAEYDCNDGRVRALYASYHLENMGRGKAIWTMTQPATWEPIPFSGVSENLWKLPCGGKK